MLTREENVGLMSIPVALNSGRCFSRPFQNSQKYLRRTMQVTQLSLAGKESQ
jgi:hypothetical protein